MLPSMQKIDGMSPEEFAFLFTKLQIIQSLLPERIVFVEQSYDGSNDDGEMYEIQIFDEDNNQIEDFPDKKIIFLKNSRWSTRETISIASNDIEEAITEIFENLVNNLHGGWELGNGAQGNITFDFSKFSITIEHRVPVIEFETIENVM